MPRVRESIIIDAPIDLVFTLSNDIEQWPEVMPEYTEARIISREGRKLWFRLTHSSGTSWISWRYVCPEDGFALAERHEPRAPFVFMQIVWTYDNLGDARTKMTWDMCFELPEPTPETIEARRQHLAGHTRINQGRMKTWIEAQYAEQAPHAKN